MTDTEKTTTTDKDLRSFHVAGNEHSFHRDSKKGDASEPSSSFKKIGKEQSFKKVG